MKLTSWRLTASLTILLCTGAVQAKDKAKTASKNSSDSNKEWKRSTEGHRPQDQNCDGVITRNEWPGNDASFKEMDSDGDGVLTNKDRGYGAQGGKTRMYKRPVNDYETSKRK
jgi:hypothetical protein